MNRLSEAAKFLIIAGTILIVCSLVVVGFFVMKEGKEGTNNSMSQFNNVISNYADVNLEMYDNLTINGSTLRDLLEEKISNNDSYQYVDLKYATKLSTSASSVTADDLDLTKTDKTKARYINPVGSFKGQVTKDDNGVISTITFTQVK